MRTVGSFIPLTDFGGEELSREMALVERGRVVLRGARTDDDVKHFGPTTLILALFLFPRTVSILADGEVPL